MTIYGVAALADEPVVEQLMTPDEVAQLLNVPRATVMDLAQGRGGAQALPAVHINSRVVRFKPDDVRAFVEATRAVATPRLADQLPRKRAASPTRRIRRTA